MNEFARDASEIFPHAANDLLDLRAALFRIGEAQIPARHSGIADVRAEISRKPAESVRALVGIDALHDPHESAHDQRKRILTGERYRTPDRPPKRPRALSKAFEAAADGRFQASNPLKANDNLAEHVAAFELFEPFSEILELHLGIDHRLHALGDLFERFRDVADCETERAEDFILLLEKLHEVDLAGRAGRGAAGDEPPAALHGEKRAFPGIGAGVLEHDIDAFFLGELAYFVFEAMRLVVDRVIGADRFRFLHLLVAADSGDHGAVDVFRELDRGGADTGAARMHEHRFARLKLRVVEQHVDGSGEGEGSAGHVGPWQFRRLHHEP